MNNLEINRQTVLDNIINEIVGVDINTIMLVMILFVSAITLSL